MQERWYTFITRKAVDDRLSGNFLVAELESDFVDDETRGTFSLSKVPWDLRDSALWLRGAKSTTGRIVSVDDLNSEFGGTSVSGTNPSQSGHPSTDRYQAPTAPSFTAPRLGSSKKSYLYDTNGNPPVLSTSISPMASSGADTGSVTLSTSSRSTSTSPGKF